MRGVGCRRWSYLSHPEIARDKAKQKVQVALPLPLVVPPRITVGRRNPVGGVLPRPLAEDEEVVGTSLGLNEFSEVTLQMNCHLPAPRDTPRPRALGAPALPRSAVALALSFASRSLSSRASFSTRSRSSLSKRSCSSLSSLSFSSRSCSSSSAACISS